MKKRNEETKKRTNKDDRKKKKRKVKWVDKIKISSLRNKKKENAQRGRAKLLKRISDKNEGSDQNNFRN